MKELTKAEEKIMQILWEIERGFVKDVIERLPEPKPAYNTVSTIVRILEKKGFLSRETFGKTHRYYPVVGRDEYAKKFLRRFVKNYFGDSYRSLVSFFARKEDLTLDEIEEIRKTLDEATRRLKGDSRDE